MEWSSRLAVAIAVAIVVTACGGDVTLRRIVHYPPVGIGRYPPESPAAAAVSDSGVAWRRGSLEAARAEARRVGRPLLVYVHTTWCGPCKRLERDTFPDPAVRDMLNKKLVPFELDGDSAPGRAFCQALKITSYPTLVFFRPDGEEIDRAFGFHLPAQLMAVADNMLKGQGTVRALARRVEENPTSVELRHKLGLQLALRGDTDQAAIHLLEAVRLDPTDKTELASESLYVLGRYVHNMKTRDMDAAAAAYDEVLQRFPLSRAAIPSAVDLAGVYAHEKDGTRAVDALRRLVRGNPRDPRRLIEAARTVLRHDLDLATGITWARQACKLRPDGYPYQTLALLYQKQGRPAERLAALQEAVRRSPENPEYKRELEGARIQQ